MDFRKVASSVHAIADAEKMSGTTVDSVYILLNLVLILKAVCFMDPPMFLLQTTELLPMISRGHLKKPKGGKPTKAEIMSILCVPPFYLMDKFALTRLECMEKVDLSYWAIDGDEQAMSSAIHVISNYNIEVADSNCFLHCICNYGCRA